MTVTRRDRDVRRAVQCVALSLLAWPRAARRRDGPSLLSAVADELAAAASGGRRALLRTTLVESAAVLQAGLDLRWVRWVASTRAVLAGGARITTGWSRDVRLAGRALRRSPGFSLAAAGTLALGIGANAAVFDLADRILLRPPPYAAPDRLVLLWSTLGTSAERLPMPAPDAAVVRERVPSLSSVAFVGRGADGNLAAVGAPTPHHAVVAAVTPDFLDVLGVRVARGRGFVQEDASVRTPDAIGRPGALGILLSDAAWRRVFAADPELPGHTVRLNGAPVIVLGITPPGFRLELPPAAGIGAEVDVWVPLRASLSTFARPDGRLVDRDSDNTGAVVGRLAEGATVERVQEELTRVAADLRRDSPGYAAAGVGLVARPLHADATAHARTLLISLLAGAAGLLLIACLGLGALLLAREMARERERAVRVALGASRWRLLRTAVSERALLLGVGCAAAALVATTAGHALAGWLPPDLAPLPVARGSVPLTFVLMATGAVAALLAVPVLLGLVRPLGGSVERTPGRVLTVRFGRARTREALVVGEVAISVVLMLGAGLLLRTAAALRDVQLGFQPRGALVFNAAVRVADAYRGPADRARLARSIEDAARSVPGVRGVGLTGALPLSGRRWTQPWGLPGESPSQWEERRADFRSVTSGYFEAVGTRLLEGRAFTREEDLDERRRVVVVDETLARRVAPEGSAVGATIGIPLDGKPVQARIVGVVEPVRQDVLDTPAREAIYVPYRQEASRDVSFVVRTAGDPAGAATEIRRAVLAVEARLAIYGMRPLTMYVDDQIAPTRFGLLLLATYAGLGLLAAALGLYGVIAWEVGRRTRDVGVRMALGATAARVRGGVLIRGLRLGGLGMLLGALSAAAAAGGLRRLIYGIGVADPTTWAGVLAVVGGVTLLACWLPARAASRLHPSEALRVD